MKIPLVQNCCFCISLRTGALILGWIGAIFGPLAFVSFIYSICEFDTIAKHQDDALIRAQIQEKNGYNILHHTESLKLMQEMRPMLRFGYYFQATLSLATSISSVFLLIGVYRDKATFIGQWLIYAVISLLAEIVYQTVVIVLAPATLKAGMFVAYLIGDIIGLGFNVYIMLSVYAYYDFVRKGNTQPFIREEL